MLTAQPQLLPCPPAGSWPLAATVDLGSRPSAVPAARHYITYLLTEWSHLARHTDDVALVVSELVTNAIRHGHGPVTLRLHADSQQLLMEVQDSLPAPPQPSWHTTDAAGGRGLGIIASLSRDWGYYLECNGKTVWALIS